MNYRIFTLLLLICFVFGACSTPNDTENSDADSNTDVQYTPLKANDGTEQDVSNQVKHILNQFDEVKAIKAVNSRKTVIAAVEVDHIKRFKLEKLEKKYRKAIMDQFPDMIIELSTDKKLVIEVDRLEKNNKKRDINRKSLDRKIQKLIKLMRKTT